MRFLVALAALLIAAPAVALVQAPSYRNPAGQLQDSLGVIVLNPDGTSGGVPVRTTSTTSATFLVNRTNRSVVSLIGLTVLSVPSQPGATKVHIACIEP